MQLDSRLFSFLQELAINNNRAWFADNKSTYLEQKALIVQYGHHLLSLMSGFDTIVRVKVFRIYVDVRFRKDKTPFKTHFGIELKRKEPISKGSYYLHLEPNNCFIAGGLWKIEKDDLLRIRREFEIDASEFRDIIGNSRLVEVWGPLLGNGVKVAPRGFSKNHNAIDLIRKNQLYFTKKFSEIEVLQPSFLNEVSESYKVILPFLNYLSTVLNTDLYDKSVL